MKKNILLNFGFFLLLSTTFNCTAAIYKWRDQNGQIHYGSNPPQGADAQKMGINATYTPPESGNKESTPAAKKLTTKGNAAAGKKQDKDEYTKEQHETLCNNARKDIETMNKSGRIRVQQEDGSTAVLGDKERDERMKNMQEMAQKHCK